MTETTEQVDRGDGPRVAAAADPWRAFLTPTDGAAFLDGWFAIALERIDGARAGVLFLAGDGGQLGLAAARNADDTLREAATALAEALARQPEPLIETRDEGALFGYPIDTAGRLQGIVVVDLARPPAGAAFRRLVRELHWSTGWIEARLWQGQAALGRAQADTARLITGLLAAAEEHERFDGAALALVNAVPEITGFDGAAVGMVRRGRVRLEAVSRTAQLARRSDRSLAYEAAMDECMAQADLVTWPALPDGRRMIDAAHRALARELGTSALVSAPLIARGEVVGVITFDRKGDASEAVALAPGLADEMRLAAAALAPALAAKARARRLVSGRIADFLGRALSAMFGRRPAIGLAVAAVALALTVPWFIPAEMRVRADATLQGAIQRAAVAPVDGFIAEAPVRAGQQVVPGELLARLDDTDLALEADAAAAKVSEARQALRAAAAKGDRAEAAVAAASLAEAEARAGLVERRLAQLEVTAPIGGLVVSGDLSQRIGAPVAAGDVLFEIAEEGGWRLMIDVSEYDLGLVSPGQAGSAVLPALSRTPLAFTVTAIAAVSDLGAGENRFRVEASVADPPAGLRPGLSGTAKIDTGRASLAKVLLRGTLDRARVALWKVLP